MPPRKIARIPDRAQKDSNLFVTWNDNDKEGKAQALRLAAVASNEYGAVATKERTYGSDIFMNAGTNVSVRDGMSRFDWEYFRPEEAIPRQTRNIIYACQMAYKRIGFIRNIIDIMGEFTCQGIRLVHQNPSVQKLYEEWAKKVNFYERSERFCNYLYRLGNVIVQRETALLKNADIENLRRGIAAFNEEDTIPVELDPPAKTRKGEIPWWYTFINPLSLDILGGEDLAQFAGVNVYGLRVPDKIYEKIRKPKSPEERYIVEQLPEYVLNAVRRQNKKFIALDNSKVRAYFYKKDDWQVWAEPVTFGVMDDLILFNKMRLADLSALDGAISHIRLWRLGDLDNKILPTQAAIARLAEVLVNNTAVGAIDLIWGPELDFKETSTEVHQFLGSEKYNQVMTNIYDGLGIPYKDGGGMASHLSTRILIERLKYGRRILNSFWEPDIVQVQQALGLRFPAQLQYDYMVLDDENAWLRLMIELCDRDLVAAETIQEMFGRVPEVEQMLIRREHQRRQSGKMKTKVGPYHNPVVEDDLLKLFVQTGLVTPGEAGVELGDRNPGEKSAMELKIQAQKDLAKQKGGQGNPFGNPSKTSKPKGKPGAGRPSGRKDSGIRKQRIVKPIKAAEFFTTRAWAREIQKTIAEFVNPIYLQTCGKDKLVKLTEEESKDLEDFKFAVLCNLQPYSEFTEDTLTKMVEASLPVHPIITQMLQATLGKFTEKFNRSPTLDETRLFQAEVYSLWKESEDNSIEEVTDG
jgi:hypothetical protein